MGVDGFDSPESVTTSCDPPPPPPSRNFVATPLRNTFSLFEKTCSIMFEVYGYYGIYDLVRYCRMGRQYLILPSPASEGYFLVILVSVCLMTSIVASFTIFLATLQSTCGFGHLLGAVYTTPVRTGVNLTSDLDSACSITYLDHISSISWLHKSQK